MVLGYDGSYFFSTSLAIYALITYIHLQNLSRYIWSAWRWFSYSEWFFYSRIESWLSYISKKWCCTRKSYRRLYRGIPKYYLNTGFLCEGVSCKSRETFLTKNSRFYRRWCLFLSITLFRLSSISFFWWRQYSGFMGTSVTTLLCRQFCSRYRTLGP